MRLILSPAILQAAYAYLSETAPFNKWNLPDAEDVIFRVGYHRTTYGCCIRYRKKLKVTISSRLHKTTAKVMETMAHEMIHVYQMHHRMKIKSNHDASWQRLAKVVCEHHGFDPGPF